MLINRYQISFLGDDSALKLVVMVTQLCDYTKNHRLAHSRRVDCMVCEFYLNEAVT